MEIVRASPISGRKNIMDIDVTQEQMDNWYNGMLIQIAMPNITAEEREFIISGIIQNEWDALDLDDEENI